ncbi:T9SS type B sorting domain-containing protein [Psychroflexus lacisalsi]|uniref:Ig-like domain-containing protein n=1 Tax=Psychroflexus lacisalsi TaxID=503928 RepID=A0ABP3VHN9_9FLAO|nr:T9SS type B sorting domain-containing protein [Psychroflexus lacisalsi]MBZ9619808.1 T9SS type B sorting domain-containing protein [Psychroflexus lacisalsi]
MNKTLLLFLIFGFGVHTTTQAQLGFCQGNSGDPIFEEDFGQGTTIGPPLPVDITSYEFVNQAPLDGQYTVSSNLMQLGSFHNATDHTGNPNGKALIINAAFDSGLFYQIPIGGLCINNSYEFSAFLMNVYDSASNACTSNEIPVNVRFQIWDETDTELLAEGDTGDIFGTSSPIWRPFALTFTTLPGQDSVILKMLNNGVGGCGNDLAIDDIIFKSCGDLTEIVNESGVNNLQFCEDESLTDLVLKASTEINIYKTPNYQWQNSQDGENWSNIPGETTDELIIPEVSTNQFYRTLVAEDVANVSSITCNSISSVFEVNLIEFINPVSLGDVTSCGEEITSIAVQSNPNIKVNWYDSPTGGVLLEQNSFIYSPESNGTFFAEATTTEGNCTNPNRVAIQYTDFDTPNLNDETLRVCENESVTLSENFPDVQYLWSNGETGNSITVDSAGAYNLQLITEDGCTVSKTYFVENFVNPVISNISQIDDSLIIELSTEGDFSYSIDGINFQDEPVFRDLSGGLYTIYVRENNGCKIVTEDFVYILIPKFLTPNGDNINDVFQIGGDTNFDEFEVIIFDRFGKVLIQSNEAPFQWNGTYNGRNLPSDDYWYRIKINDEIYSGNISLIR